MPPTRQPLKKLINKYHIGDSRKLRHLFPYKEYINVTITSPPYWNLKDYGSKSQIGFGQTYNGYMDDLVKVFSDVYGMTRKNGSLWIISDTIKFKGQLKLLPFDLAKRLTEVGWILQDIIIWTKDKTLPWSHQGKLRNIFEYIAFFSKGPDFKYRLSRVREISELKDWWVRYPERYSPLGKAPARTWYFPIPCQGSWGNNWVRHFNPLPPSMIKRILLLTTDRGDIVVDPFCGSGTVLAQACVMDRDFIGIDLSKKYRDMYQKHVLPAIRAIHATNEKQDREIGRRKRQFRKLILALRKMKFAKELIRLYRGAHGLANTEAIIALKASKNDSLHVIFLFSEKSEIPSGFLERMTALCHRPPLSKYGIIANLQVSSINGITRKWLSDKGCGSTKKIFLYLNGRMYAWAENMTVMDFIDSIKNRNWHSSSNENYPPIFSDIAVKINDNNSVLKSDVES